MSAATPPGSRPGLLRRLLLQPAALLALEAGLVFGLLIVLLSLPFLLMGVEKGKVQFDHHLKELASVIASRIDGDLHETLVSREQQSGEVHDKLQSVLVRIQNAVPSIHALYTMRYRDGGLVIILDAARSADLVRPTDPPSFLTEPLDFDLANEPDTIPTLMAGQAYVDRGAYDSGGTRRPMRSVSAPIRDAAGNVVAILGMDYEESLYAAEFERRRDHLLRVAATLDGLLVLGVMGLVYWLRRSIGRALDDLALESSTDALTRLGNRRSFDLRLQQAVNAARERQTPLSVLVLDADRFKEVNDSWGHPVGDAVLTRIADCLRAERNPPRDIFRVGGEEFAMLLPGVVALDAIGLYNRLNEAIRRPMVLPAARIEITMSGGIAELDPRTSESPEDLLLRADAALYLAKNLGRDNATIAPPAGS
jgi:diguanylate cyclase (GGDEF)-like protein